MRTYAIAGLPRRHVRPAFGDERVSDEVGPHDRFVTAVGC